ncbi:MAG: hypothetical protein KGJ59_07375 [Bacteroidota bacterium]|nr:hypothetical protein [Bacteroidota bacterium]
MRPKPDRFMPALYGGLVIAGISAIPGLNLLNCLCCAGIMLGGFLAVLFYRQELTPEMDPLTSNDCVRLGALSGVIAAVAGTFISVLISLVFGNVAIAVMLQIIHRMNVEIPAELQQQIDLAMAQGISLLGIVTSFVFSLVLDSIFAVLGGLIGWAVLKPKPQMPQHPV